MPPSAPPLLPPPVAAARPRSLPAAVACCPCSAPPVDLPPSHLCSVPLASLCASNRLPVLSRSEHGAAWLCFRVGCARNGASSREQADRTGCASAKQAGISSSSVRGCFAVAGQRYHRVLRWQLGSSPLAPHVHAGPQHLVDQEQLGGHDGRAAGQRDQGEEARRARRVGWGELSVEDSLAAGWLAGCRTALERSLTSAGSAARRGSCPAHTHTQASTRNSA